jgi:hypothetical protein
MVLAVGTKNQTNKTRLRLLITSNGHRLRGLDLLVRAQRERGF